jgi:hypothetical protein
MQSIACQLVADVNESPQIDRMNLFDHMQDTAELSFCSLILLSK